MAKSEIGKLKMGMVGGGPGSFIGDAHVKAAQFDGGVELVAGAFSSTRAKSEERGRRLYLHPDRVYGSHEEMIEKELRLPAGERIDFVAIVTPNHLHYRAARDFLNAGFHVVCDKPMTLTLVEALALRNLARRKPKQVFALTHNYTGYPMVKLARDMARQERLGRILKVVVQYPQGWLVERIEKTGSKQAEWRTDPKRAGKAGAMGDIGTHAANLAEYVTGLRITELCADLASVVSGRKLDDDGNCLLRFDSGARGVLIASQVCAGELNGLRIRIYGQKGHLYWRQETPETLDFCACDGCVTAYRRGTAAISALSQAAAAATRIPFGHPEGFYEAFATIYKNATDTMRARLEGRKPSAINLDFPGVDDGVRGLEFIETVIKSSKSKKWVKWIR
ncbi:MAG: Gfo/Idh/MocA family oxidoreductase [Verrucomicrobiota bacterium]|nr:Gfo/Idh/MocA family oxidoreductase [Verrucomicrobiota bacterium]